MSLRPDQKALVFIGVVAVLGAGVRLSRASDVAAPASGADHALTRQMASADSAASAQRARRPGSKRTQRSGKRSTADSTDSAADAYGSTAPRQGTPSRKRRGGPLDRPGYVGGRLDLDVATAAQIDSLPGIAPTLARRIAADRMRRGPFLSFDGLRRVTGVGPLLIAHLDTLVTFSGTYVQGDPKDSLVPPRRRGRPKR